MTASLIPIDTRMRLFRLHACVTCGTTFRASREWYVECRACYHGKRVVRGIVEAARHLRETTR